MSPLGLLEQELKDGDKVSDSCRQVYCRGGAGARLQVQLRALPGTLPRFRQRTQNQPCTSPARGCSRTRGSSVPPQGHGADLGWKAGFTFIPSIPPCLFFSTLVAAAPRWWRRASPGPVRGESVRAARSGTTPRLCPLPSPSSFVSHCVRMSSALPRPRARCQQRWPGWKISPAPPGGNWVSRSDGSNGSDGSRAGTRGTGPVIQRVPAAPSEPGLIQQGQGALLLQARPLGHPLFAGKIKDGVFFIV